MTSDTAGNEVYDVVVVGGGLLGAGVARDAALRGLSVALLAGEDFGAGAAARGNPLVLGGLGALESLDFTRVRQDVREREILIHAAPHLVRPQGCLIPFYSPSLLAQTRLRAGLALSDALGFELVFDHAPRVHQLLSAAGARRRVPGLRPAGLSGAALVWEAAVSRLDRLALELALDARRHGAALHAHVRVDEVCREPRPDGSARGRAGVGGVRWADTLTGKAGHAASSLVIWAADVPPPESGFGRLPEPHRIRAVSMTGPALDGAGDALVFPREEEAAPLFAVSRPGGCWVGSLTVDGDGPAYATGAEVAALAGAIRAFLPGADWGSEGSAQAASAPSVPRREAAEAPGWNGLLLAPDADAVSFRRVAEDVVDLACRKLGRWLSLPPCRTAFLPLPPPADGPLETLEAAVERAVAEEECRTLRDLLERRLPGPATDAERRAVLADALEALSGRLGWDAARQAAEVKAWRAERALTQAFRVL